MTLLKQTFGHSGDFGASARTTAPKTGSAKTVKKSKLAGALVAALALSLAAGVPADAASTKKSNRIAERGASERVAFSDKLRMYSQRMAASACTKSSGVAPTMSQGFLAVASREFNRIVNALENGDRALGIVGSEENRKTLKLIKGLRAQWEPMLDIVNTILVDGASDNLTAELVARNEQLMDYSATVVGVISGQYSDPTALLQSDAIRLGIAGRQRMLSQKMSNEACLIQTGFASDATPSELAATVAQFEVSLTALQNGLPAAGVYPSDKPEIQAGLSVVAKHWADLRIPLQALSQGVTWSDETQANVFNGLNVLVHEMDKVVILYTKDSKLSL